jgi:hypothetical protein
MNGQTLTTLYPAPSLPAIRRVDGTPGLRVWCCYCRKHHLHGTGYGHRVAHCSEITSPYRKTGYVLIPPENKGTSQ